MIELGFILTALVLWMGFAIIRFMLRESARQQRIEATLGRRLTVPEANAYWRTEQSTPSVVVIRSGK